MARHWRSYPHTYPEAVKALNGRQRRKMPGTAMALERIAADDGVALRYRDCPVVIFYPGGAIELNVWSHWTRTSADRIQSCGVELGVELDMWHVRGAVFDQDGFRLEPDGVTCRDRDGVVIFPGAAGHIRIERNDRRARRARGATTTARRRSPSSNC